MSAPQWWVVASPRLQHGTVDHSSTPRGWLRLPCRSASCSPLVFFFREYGGLHPATLTQLPCDDPEEMGKVGATQVSGTCAADDRT